MITIEQFANFELALEWRDRWAATANHVPVSEAAADATFLTGPEMQLTRRPLIPGRQAGWACYGLYAPSRDVTKPADSWNAVRLIANRSHIEHWLNGVRIVEYELGSPDWLARLRLSPYRDTPTYGRESIGHIALQEHGARVAFRSLKLIVMP